MRGSKLAEEIKKRRPFETPAQEAYLNLWRTCAALTESFERLFRAHGLCPTHYNILRTLAGEKAGGGGGLPALEVRERLITRVPDITRLVDKLVERGLVRRERPEADRRLVLLTITPEGEALVNLLAGPVSELHARQLGHLSDDELTTLSALLEKARAVPE